MSGTFGNTLRKVFEWADSISKRLYGVPNPSEKVANVAQKNSRALYLQKHLAIMCSLPLLKDPRYAQRRANAHFCPIW